MQEKSDKIENSVRKLQKKRFKFQEEIRELKLNHNYYLK